jgi:hypothetical protein
MGTYSTFAVAKRLPPNYLQGLAQWRDVVTSRATETSRHGLRIGIAMRNCVPPVRSYGGRLGQGDNDSQRWPWRTADEITQDEAGGLDLKPIGCVPVTHSSVGACDREVPGRSRRRCVAQSVHGLPDPGTRLTEKDGESDDLRMLCYRHCAVVT